MTKLRLSVACDDYDIVLPLIDGTVQAEGLDLVFLADMGPRERHWRMGRKHEFDVCEENVGAYYMARNQGEPLTAIPDVPPSPVSSRFRVVNTSAGIKSPGDLAGKTIGGTQTSSPLPPTSGCVAFLRSTTAFHTGTSPGWSIGVRTSRLKGRPICALR